MQRYEEPRLEEPGLDNALEAGRDWLRELCARNGGSPVGIVAEPLRGGCYLVRLSWTIQQPGGRRGRKRRQQQSAELLPPQRTREERIVEELPE